MPAAKLTVDLEANITRFTDAMNTAAAKLEGFGKKSDSVLARIKESFGRGSTFAQISKLFAGGGAIIGLKFATREIAGMAEAGAKFADAIRSGDGNSASLAQELAKSVPIIGDIVSAGASINEILTGNQLYLKQANDQAKMLADTAQRITTGFEASAKAVASLGERFEKLSTASERFDADARGKRLIDVRETAASRVKAEIQAGESAAASILNPKGAATIADLVKSRSQLQTQISGITVPELIGGHLVATRGGGAYAPGNEGVVNSAKAEISRLQTQLNSIRQEIRSRQVAVRPVLDAASANVSLAEKLGTKEYASASAQGGSPFALVKSGAEAAKGFWTAFKLGVERGASVLNINQRTATPYARNAFPVVSSVYDWLNPPKTEKAIRQSRINMPNPLQPAREFRFTEGIPGGRSGPIEQLNKSVQDNTKAQRDNTRHIQRQNDLLNKTLSGGDSATVFDLA